MAGLSLCIIFFAFSFSARNAQGEPFQAPSYNINLDLPPEERWVNVTSKYAKYSPLIVDAIRQEIPTYLVPLAELLALYMEKHFPEPFPAEMRGVSKGLNLTLTDTLLLNIMYDLTAFCTSVVAQDNQGSIFHGRNLDYRFTGILRNITFISNFQSKGNLPFFKRLSVEIAERLFVRRKLEVAWCPSVPVARQSHLAVLKPPCISCAPH